MSLTFLVTDDHSIFRSGLKLTIQSIYPDAVVYEAASAADSEARLNQPGNIDLVLLDLTLPDSEGLNLLSRLRLRYPTTPFAVISASEDRHLVQEAIDLGALGYLPKSSSNAVISGAIRLILSGGIYIPPELLSAPTSQSPVDMGLTPRQLEVLKLLAEGLSNKQIGAQLSIAPGTIKAHIAAILRELNAGNRTQAVHRARELKIL